MTLEQWSDLDDDEGEVLSIDSDEDIMDIESNSRNEIPDKTQVVVTISDEEEGMDEYEGDDDEPPLPKPKDNAPKVLKRSSSSYRSSHPEETVEERLKRLEKRDKKMRRAMKKMKKSRKSMEELMRGYQRSLTTTNYFLRLSMDIVDSQNEILKKRPKIDESSREERQGMRGLDDQIHHFSSIEDELPNFRKAKASSIDDIPNTSKTLFFPPPFNNGRAMGPPPGVIGPPRNMNTCHAIQPFIAPPPPFGQFCMARPPPPPPSPLKFRPPPPPDSPQKSMGPNIMIQNGQICIFCDTPAHKSEHCKVYSTWMERRKRLNDKNTCWKCFAPNNIKATFEHNPCPNAQLWCNFCFDNVALGMRRFNHHPILCGFAPH